MQSELLGLWGLEGRDPGTLWTMDFLAYLVRSFRVWLAVWRCLRPASFARYGELQAQIVLACLNSLHMALYLEWLIRLVVSYVGGVALILLCRSEDRSPVEVAIRLISMCYTYIRLHEAASMLVSSVKSALIAGTCCWLERPEVANI